MLLQHLTTAEISPAIYKLGETNSEVNIDTAKENVTAVISLAQQACRNINIFTQNLDSDIYDNNDFTKAISKLALGDNRTIIRILVHDSIYAIRSEHRLLKLAQSIPGKVYIRNPSRLYQHIRCSYMVADSMGYVYRDKPHRGNYDASVNFMSPQRASTLDNDFMEAWEQSTIDRNIRRLHI